MNDILFGNSNRPVIKKLSNRYFKAGKSRNIIAIIAIALTTILFTTIFTLGSGLIDTVHDQNIRKQGGDGQAVLNYISDEVFDNIKGNEMIEQIAYPKHTGRRQAPSGSCPFPCAAVPENSQKRSCSVRTSFCPPCEPAVLFVAPLYRTGHSRTTDWR